MLVEPIGSGAQATVWRALGPLPGRRPVAVKLITGASRRSRKQVARLCREAIRGRLLDHPSILPVYDYGWSGDTVYMAMRLADGGPLRAVIEQRRRLMRGEAVPGPSWPAALPGPAYVRTIVALMAQVAGALARAHRSRVIHQDVKPCNILLDGRRRAFLADFGIGRDLDRAPPGALFEFCGTPTYMAPERLRSEPYDPFRCDIYAAGMTLLEALTLRAPFDLPEILHPAAIAAAIADQRPRPLRSECPEVPARLEAIVERATAHDPGRRHPTAAALAADLEALAASLA